MTTILPFGTWPSPLSAAEVTASAPRIDGARFVGDDVWWSESLPHERGRTAILRRGLDAAAEAEPEPEPNVVLPAPWSARSRVHEYGGGAWTVDDRGTLFFVEQSDQRIWRLGADGEPHPLTPEAPGTHYGDLTWAGGRLLAVRESVRDGRTPERAIVEFDVAAGVSPSLSDGTPLAAGYDFLAYPRLSPDGARLAFIGWNHPNMPWDATQLVVSDLRDGGSSVVSGGADESVLQPEWTGPDEVTYTTDRSGRWTLERRRLSESAQAQATAAEATDTDTGGPLWNLGARWFAPLQDGRILAVRTHGRDELVVEDTDGAARSIPIPLSAQVLIRDVRGTRALVTGAGSTTPSGLWVLDVDDPAAARPLRGGVSDRSAGWLPEARALTFEGPSGAVHAFAYPPTNPGVEGPADARPPYIVTVHGGPTAHVAGEASPAVAYFTSRGIGVLDVNYGGSSGYGRAYRERLAGQWGIVDVEDVVAAAEGLVGAGLADGARLAIKGGSAGGWTVLSALTTSKTFSAGISRYGVADLRALATDTHDFEAHYLDGLVGPLPEAEAVYEERSPLGRIDNLSVPVLLLQGADDPVVPPAQAYAMRDALAAKGLKHALVVYEGESHGFRRAETIQHALESELSFLGQVFGFATPGVPLLPLEP